MSKISVIMSVFNETEKELNESINSICNQTFSDFEFLIVNDNPENSTIKLLLSSFEKKDKRITVINNEKNIGLAMSLNKALSMANGEYIARMDADDISLENRFQLQVEYLDSHLDCSMVSANKVDIDENSELLGSETNFKIKDEDIEKVLPYGSVIIHPSVMIRKDVFDKMQGYNNFRAAQDYDLWLRIISSGYKIHIQPEKLIKYRIRETSITNSNYSKQYFYTKFALYKNKNRMKNNSYDLKYHEEDISSFLDKVRANDKKYIVMFNKTYNKIYKKNRSFISLVSSLPFLLLVPELFKVLYRDIRFKDMLKKYNNL